MRLFLGMLLAATLVLRTTADGEVQAQAFTPNEFRALYELMVQYKYGRANNCPTVIKYSANPIEDGEDLLIRHRDMKIGDNGLENCTDVGAQRLTLSDNLRGRRLDDFLDTIDGNLDKRTVFDGLRDELAGRRFFVSISDSSRTCGVGRKWFERSETFFYFDESDTIRLTVVAKVTGGEPKFLSLPLVGNIRYMIAVTSGTSCIYRVQTDVANVILGTPRPSDTPSSSPRPSGSSTPSASASQVPEASSTPSSSSTPPASVSSTPSASSSSSESTSPSASTSPSMSVSQSPSRSPSAIPSVSPTRTPSSTQSSTPSSSSTSSATPSASVSSSASSSASATQTPSTSASPTSSTSASPTSSPIASPTPSTSASPTRSKTPTPTPSRSTTPMPSTNPTPTRTPSTTPTPTRTASSTPGPSSTRSVTPTPTKTQPSAPPSSAPSASLTPSLTPSQLPPTKTPTPSSLPPIALPTTRVTPFPNATTTPSTVPGAQDVPLGSATPTGTPSALLVPLGSASPSANPSVNVDGGNQFGSEDRNSSTLDGTSTCFPGSATVTVRGGQAVRMEDLRVGDMVWNGGRYEAVMMFTHESAAAWAEFVRIRTTGGGVTLTGGHYLYVNGRLTPAREVGVGDRLSSGVVVGTEWVVGRGLYNPQTASGEIVVDGVLASCYTDAVAPIVGHALLSPLRVARLAVPALVATLGRAVERFAQVGVVSA